MDLNQQIIYPFVKQSTWEDYMEAAFMCNVCGNFNRPQRIKMENIRESINFKFLNTPFISMIQ